MQTSNMVLESLPNRPLPISVVEQLPEKSERIENVTPITVIEDKATGRSESAISFVLTTSTASWFGLVFDRDDETWKSVFEKHYESEEEAENEFHAASEAIKEYWEERTEMEETGTVEGADGTEFTEFTSEW